MPRVQLSPSNGVLVGVVILGVIALGPVVAGAAVTASTDRIPEANPPMTENESAVEIDVDCNRSSVELVLPEEHQYDVTVGVANVTPTATSVSRSTLGSVEGNTTVEVEDEGGIVFTIVQNRSEDGDVAATDVTNCGEVGERTTTVRTETELAMDVDCENGSIQFNASEGTEYVAKVTVVELSATGTSTSSSTRTFEGNATVPIAEEGLVAAFASTGELGDDTTVSAVRNCSSFGTDTDSTDETETAST